MSERTLSIISTVWNVAVVGELISLALLVHGPLPAPVLAVFGIVLAGSVLATIHELFEIFSAERMES